MFTSFTEFTRSLNNRQRLVNRIVPKLERFLINFNYQFQFLIISVSVCDRRDRHNHQRFTSLF